MVIRLLIANDHHPRGRLADPPAAFRDDERERLCHTGWTMGTTLVFASCNCDGGDTFCHAWAAMERRN